MAIGAESTPANGPRRDKRGFPLDGHAGCPQAVGHVLEPALHRQPYNRTRHAGSYPPVPAEKGVTMARTIAEKERVAEEIAERLGPQDRGSFVARRRTAETDS